MLVQELYEEIADRCNLDSTNATDQTRMLNSANNQLKRIFTNLNLMSERSSATLTTVADQALYRLDRRVLRSLNFRETNSPAKLNHMSRSDFEKEHPNPTDTGVPSFYIPMRKVRVTEQPTSASVVTVASTSAGDVTNYFVIVKGISGGVLQTERLTLNGVTSVASTNSYTSLLSISKDTTNGTVTATSNAAAVTNISLLPGERELEHWEIRLHVIPDGVYSIPYTFQYVPWGLSLDEETIPMPDVFIDSYLAYVTADILFKQGDQKYTTWKQEATTMIEEIKDRNYLGEDDDLRFGFEDIGYSGDFT